MKKLLLLALAAVMMAGCEYENKNQILPKYTIKGSNIKFMVIDSCEYIVNIECYAYAHISDSYETYTHKGNCKYCEQRRQKEIREIINELRK